MTAGPFLVAVTAKHAYGTNTARTVTVSIVRLLISPSLSLTQSI